MSGPVSLLIFRKQEISSSGFRLPFAGIIAPMAFAFSALIIYWSGFPDTFYMSIIAFAGLILFAFKNKGTHLELKSGMWIILILVVIPLVSYLGSYNLNIIKYPFDLLLVFIVSLSIFYMGIKQSSETTTSIQETYTSKI